MDNAIQRLKGPVVISGTACKQWIFCNLTCTTLRDGPLFNHHFQIVAVYLTLFTYLQCLTKGAKYRSALHLSLLTGEGKSTDYEITFQIPALMHWCKLVFNIQQVYIVYRQGHWEQQVFQFGHKRKRNQSKAPHKFSITGPG